ncbi:MAG: response regulator [Syntrophobacteraceae bacterium]
MLDILLVTARRETIHAFIEGLSCDPEVRLHLASAGAEVPGLVRTLCPKLVIVDSTPEEVGSFDLVRQIIGVNAMVNTAVTSPLSEEEFHDRGEGLGILSCLPMDPGGSDAKALLQKLRDLL